MSAGYRLISRNICTYPVLLIADINLILVSFISFII